MVETTRPQEWQLHPNLSSQHRRGRRPHEGPDANHHQHQKKHPLHRKAPKKSPLVGELIRPSSHDEDGGEERIKRSVSPHHFLQAILS